MCQGVSRHDGKDSHAKSTESLGIAASGIVPKDFGENTQHGFEGSARERYNTNDSHHGDDGGGDQ